MKAITTQLSWIHIRKMNDDLFNAVSVCIKRITRLIKPRKNRSCIAGKRHLRISRTTYPFGYNKNNPMSGFNEAALGWSFQEQEKVREHYLSDDDTIAAAAYLEKCNKVRQMVDEEIAMEMLYMSGLEVLVKR